jgi:5-methyltetrahydropteroyltriglutamate--homocysteine methyltransferase
MRHEPEDLQLTADTMQTLSKAVKDVEMGYPPGLLRYAEVVGRERVMAGSDCGYSTFMEVPTVWPDIVWGKMTSLVEGARMASAGLWPQGAG